ncbi:MAG: RNA polymerase factor sigma-54 [Coriobacteriales bacterium]|jgi:RNA polymerase sigma-54 factor|nr:RNA polymerase factor sigma-54 [Coriobacteriales bacterium]
MQLRTETAPQLQTGVRLGIEAQTVVGLLGMSSLELSEFVQNSLEQNPFLEEAEQTRCKHPLDGRELLRQAGDPFGASRQMKRQGTRDVASEEFQRRLYDQAAAQAKTIEEAICEQMDLELADPRNRAISHYIAGSIDAAGYLRASDEEIAEALGVEVARVQRIVRAIQAGQPAGIAARDLAERLLLQLERIGEDTELARCLIGGNLYDLAAGKITAVASACKASAAEVQQVLDTIRSLDPHPEAGFFTDTSTVIYPEIMVRPTPEGITVTLQDYYLPEISVNEAYVGIAQGRALDKQTSTYLRKQLKAAQALIKGIEQRKQTLIRISSAVVYYQEEFFRHGGVQRLRPLTMAQVAERAEVHESTVSRVARNSWLQTPFGVYSLRFFFISTAVHGASAPDGDVSSQAIKAKIRELVEHEDPHQPLSDQDICDALTRQDLSISRRTVNKYRKALNIPAQAQRRRY